VTVKPCDPLRFRDRKRKGRLNYHARNEKDRKQVFRRSNKLHGLKEKRKKEGGAYWGGKGKKNGRE